VEDCIHFAAKRFNSKKIYFGHGTDNAWDEAVYLVLSALNLPPDADHKVLGKKPDQTQKETVIELVNSRLKDRIPTSYLTKESWFAGLPFYVDERVLIPRSPLAELIQDRFVPWIDPEQVSRILDIGTGSGCIAIACAYAFPKATIDAVDISDGALEVAKINCEKHKVTKRVRVLKSDLFENLGDKTYNIIISNPPYVGNLEMKSLPKEYYHEPEQALLAGKAGDEIIGRIIADAAKHLSPKGILVVEVGNSAPLVIIVDIPQPLRNQS